jgi:tRNA threonylcarbamoyladenosine biosynthesis protein TsaB
MNILALDTSMGACSAAILRTSGGEQHLHARQTEMPRGHAEALMPMVEAVFAEAEIGAQDLDRIASTIGPGSFTGVRIGIAAARGLALVTNAQLYGTDSLTVMARAARLAGIEGPFAVAADARRGMLYFGLYDATGAKLDGPQLVSRDDAAALLPEDFGLAVGSGARLLAEAASARGHAVEAAIEAALETLQPSAAALASLAYESGETCAALRPLYLRPPDAKPQAPELGRR